MIVKDQRQERGKTDAYIALASLSFPLYVTTSWTDLLEDALWEAGRKPVVRYLPWREEDYTEDIPMDPPDPEHPLVYHLFGTISEPWSLLLTEDDYFAWSNAWATRRMRVPASVRRALAASSLLLLGWPLEDRDLSIFLEGIRNLGGAN